MPTQAQSIFKEDSGETEAVIALTRALRQLALSNRMEAPPFNGKSSGVETWVIRARIYLEATGEAGRSGVLQLASKFSDEAILWFGEVEPSPTTGEELIRGVISRFKGEIEKTRPDIRFCQTLKEGKKPTQTWEDFMLMIKFLAERAQMRESSAVNEIRRLCPLMDVEIMVSASSWQDMLRLACFRDAEPEQYCEFCKIKGHHVSVCRKKQTQSGSRQ